MNNKEILQLVGNIVFVGSVFYLFYASLWIFCPC